MQKLQKIEKAEGVIEAQEDGVLESIEASVGTVTSGTEQIILQTGGPEACGAVPAEQIGIPETGDEIQIQVQGDSESFPIQIERFETDKEGNTLWFGKTEKKAYRTGTPLSYEYIEKSEVFYETLIPLGALHEAMGETYVLTAEIRSGILGEEYTAVKVPVTVLKKDDTNAAVQTSLSGEALIITQSNKYVKEGDRVRLSE